MNEQTKVKVICDNSGGGGDEWAIGKTGVVMSVEDDGYCEVRLDGHGDGTYQFADYQLEEIP